MQFTIGTNSTDDARKAEAVALAFETNGNRLTAVANAIAPFDVVVQSFDPVRYISYRAPEALTPEELSAEVEIHVPRSLPLRMKSRVLPGTLDGLVLMQHIASTSPAIPPIAALEKILRSAGTVNSAMLHADNGGILFVHNAGMEIHAEASAHSLKEFLNVSTEERALIFPDFSASEIILSGYDLDHFQNLDLGSLSPSRRIAISDFTGLCEFTPEAIALVETNPHLYTLVIGTAAVYAEILREKEINSKQ